MEGSDNLSFQMRLQTEELQKDVENIKRQLAGISNSATLEGNKIDNTFSRIGATIAGAFTIKAATDFISKVIAVRAEIESLGVSFETLLGNKEKADAMMESIREFAVKTPMQMKDLAQGAQTMLAFNIEAEKVMPILKALGDVSMGDAQKFQSLTLAFSQMSSTGKLMGQDLMQMINAGFNPLSQISEKTGKSIGELKDEMSKGAISAEMVTQAFIDATSEGGKFYQMLEKQSQGIEGSISNLQGAISDMFNDLGSAIQEPVTDALQGLTEIIKHYEDLGKILADIVAYYGAYKAGVMVSIAVDKLKAVSTTKVTIAEKAHTIALKAATKAQKLLNLEMLKNPYVLAAAAIATLVIGILKLTAHSRELKKEARETAEAIGNEQGEATYLLGKLEKLDSKTDEYKDTLKKLNDLYPDIIQQYTDEEGKLLDIAAARQAILDKIREEVAERRALDKVQSISSEFAGNREDALEKIRKYLYKHYNDTDARLKLDEIQSLLPTDYNTPLNTQERQDLINKVGRIAYEGNQTFSISMWNRLASGLNDYLDALANANKAQKDFNDIYSQFGVKTPGKSQEQALEESTEETNKANKELTEEEKKAAEQRRKQRDRANAELMRQQRQWSEQQKALTKELAEDEEKARIDGMEEGLAKTLAQNQLNYDSEISDIEKRQAQMVDQLKQQALKEWEKTNPNSSETAKEQYLNSLTLDSMADMPKFQDAIQAIADFVAKKGDIAWTKFQRSNAEALANSIENYRSYEEQRLALAQEHQRKIEALYVTDENGNKVLRAGVTEETIESINKEYEKADNDLTVTIANKQATFQEWCNSIADYTLGELENLLKKAKNSLEEAKKNGITGDKLAEAEAKVIEINNKIAKINATEAVTPGTEAEREWSKLRSSVDSAANSISTLGDEIGGAVGEILKMAATATTSFSAVISNVQQLTRITAEGIEESASAATKAIRAAEEASVVLAIVSELYKIVSSFNELMQNLGLQKSQATIARAEEQAKKLAGKDHTYNVNQLAKAYDKLGEAVDKAYGNSKADLYRQQLENLEKQLEELAAAESEENEKKNPDYDKVDEYRDQQEEIRDQIEETKRAELDAIFGSDIQSAIEDLSSAIVDAWTGGNSVVTAFGDFTRTQMKAYLSQMISDYIASMGVAEKIRAKIEAANADGIITEDEWRNIESYGNQLAEEAKRELGWVENLLKSITDEENSATKRGIATASQDSVNELNGRATAIQGHTYSISENTRILQENTATILGSILRIEHDIANLRIDISDMKDTQASTQRMINNATTNGIKIR